MQVTPVLRRLAAQDAASPLGRAAAAMLCVAFATFVRFLIEPFLDGEIGYATFFPAVVVATLWAGRSAGALAIALSIAAVWAFVPPYFQVVDGWALGAAKLVTFGASAGFLVLAASAFRDAIRELDRRLVAEAEIGEALKASEARFRSVFDSGAVGVAVVNMADDAQPLEVNARFLQIAGVDRATWEAGGWTWRDATSPEDLAKDEVAARALQETGLPQSFEKNWIRPDGSRVSIVLSAALMPDAPGMAVVTVQDVSDARRAQDALQESEARFRSIANTAPAPIWVTGSDGKRQFVNDAYCDFVGRPYEAALTLDWREVLHPEDALRIRDESVAGETSGEPFSLLGRYRCASGDWRWLRSYSRPRKEGGEHAGFVGVAFDVTETVEAEAALRESEARLEERVAAALSEKEQAEAALLQAQKLEAVGRLTGGVAHDFNNLLTVVIGSLDSILKRGEDPARRTRMAEAALQAARRGERLTQQLLAFSRRQALRPEVVDLGELVRESETLLRRAVGEAATFEVRTAEAPLWTKVDPAQFEAALLNLVVNARDATPGGGRIVVDVWERRFGPGEVGEGREGDYVCVEVADTGSGMTPEVLARVFEPFFTTKPIGKGTGLGLAQVYGFARQSGGDAEVFSTVGRGTRVALRLPRVAAQEPAPVRETVASARAEARGARVLLAEDDPAVGVLAEALLIDAGCEVTRVETAEPALVLLRDEQRFDVLLTDVVMPGSVNGVELARQAAALRPELRIVLTSGYVGEALDGTVGDAPWPLLRKPYTFEELVEAVGAPARAAEPA